MSDIKHIESRIADDFEKVANEIKKELEEKAFSKDAEGFLEMKTRYNYLTKLTNRFINSKEG